MHERHENETDPTNGRVSERPREQESEPASDKGTIGKARIEKEHVHGTSHMYFVQWEGKRMNKLFNVIHCHQQMLLVYVGIVLMTRDFFFSYLFIFCCCCWCWCCCCPCAMSSLQVLAIYLCAMA